MVIFQSEARFVPWVFTVSHNSLLVRGPGKDGWNNTDIMFSGVIYCELPEIFDGIVIENGAVEDVERLRLKCGLKDTQINRVYGLQSVGRRYYVVASHFRKELNNLSPEENNLLG